MKTKIVALLLVLPLIATSVISFLPLTVNPPVQEQVAVPSLYQIFMSSASEVTIADLNQILSAANATFAHPTWLPLGLSLTAVYAKFDPFVAIVTYSDRGIKDFRLANVTIELAVSGSPTRQTMMASIDDAIEHLTQIGSVSIVLNDKAVSGDPITSAAFGPSPYCYFWAGGLYYQMNARYPLTSADLTQIISSMFA